MANETSELDKILKTRGEKYGPYSHQFICSQEIKSQWGHPKGGSRFTVLKEGYEMIALKMSRIAKGDITDVDTWQDIAGYAQLMVDHLKGDRK